MKKGTFTLLGTRKAPTPLDTKIEVKKSENADPVLASAAIPESGTAMLKPRPTVKHYTPSSPSINVQYGLAVPTPKVPLLPPTNRGKADGREISSPPLNGTSIFNSPEDDIFLPPPPLMEPPPLPVKSIRPAVGNFSSSSTPDLPAWQPPSPKPELRAPSHPPYFAPVSPPPVFVSSKKTSDLPGSKTYEPTSITQSDSLHFTKHVDVAPFSFPAVSEKRPEAISPKVQKVPSVKPNTQSSLQNENELAQPPGPTFPPPVATPSSFNPQNNAKIYSMQKNNILTGQNDFDNKPNKPIVFLEDLPTDSIPVQFSGKTSPPITDSEFAQVPDSLVKPAQNMNANDQQQKDLNDLRDVLQATLPSGRIGTPIKDSGALAAGASFSVNTPPATENLTKPHESSRKPSYIITPTHKKSRYGLDVSRKTYHIDRGSRGLRSKECAASPMALLLAAKEREKRKSSPKSESPPLSPYYKESKDSPLPTPDLNLNLASMSMSDHKPNPAERQNLSAASSSPSSRPTSHKEVAQDFSAPFLPPPPEFANNVQDTWQEDDLSQLPPSLPPPDPPAHRSQLSVVPTISPEPKPPKDLGPNVEPMLGPETTSLADSHRTLQDILRKKQLEQWQGPEPDSQGQPKTDKDLGVQVSKSPTNKKPGASVSGTLPSQSHNMFLSELENKVSKKAQESSGMVTELSSNGAQSKPSYGMSFTVRPGNRQPIIRKEDSP